VIGDDVAALAFDARIGADVGRDALVIAGRFDVDGRTGRDVRTQAWSLDISGEVVRDVVARVSDLTVEPNASVGGDLVFRASGDIDIEDDTVGGFVAGQEVISPVWAKAVARAVAWLSLLGFVVGGAALLWMFRRTGERAVALTAERPGRSALVGALLVVAGPILVMPLSLSLVGLPIALLILVLWLVALVLGPAPAVAQVGSKILAGRGGVVGGLVIGAMVWRGAIWLLSLVGALIYLAALFIGLGSFAIAGWEARRDAGDDWRPLPPEVAAA
ncbi:hypothetical protein HQ535_15705, partial [bacterium]|nr:hypothetical protein [bacterium]